jgi:PAS domain S-box-containing protein
MHEWNTMKPPVKLLYIQDNALDRGAFLRMAGDRGFRYEITPAETLGEARARLAEGRFDVIVADYSLPDGPSTELFDAARDTPFVLLAGTLDEGLALRTLESVAGDYLHKTPDHRHLEALPFTIEKTLHRKHLREREQQLARQLLESEECLRFLEESMKDYGIYMLDRDGCVTTWNSGAERIIGWKAKEVLGRHFSVFFPPEDVAAGKPQRLLAMAAREGAFHEQARRLRRDGSTFWADVTLSAVKDECEELIGFGKVTHDITERKLVDREILAAVDRERQRLGRELHDGLCQDLAATKFKISLLERKLAANAGVQPGELKAVEHDLNRAIEQARGVAQGLNPVQLAGEGLAVALEELAGNVQTTFQLRCVCECSERVAIADHSMAQHLYRIAQEAVHNALQHGKAESIRIQLNDLGDRISLAVLDDGVGFPTSPRRAGMGLQNMRARADLIGGSLDIQPGEDGGTVVTCTFARPAAEPKALLKPG